ncbi:AAA ATPase [Microbotryomycetes sp. JL221]|nr:AAA ATPase [Microbotryomycetes sp. JL221]
MVEYSRLCGSVPAHSTIVQAQAVLGGVGTLDHIDAGRSLVGRHEQRRAVLDFIADRTSSRQELCTNTEDKTRLPPPTKRAVGALFVSGPPGSGKTVLMQSILDGMTNTSDDHTAATALTPLMINCSTFGSDKRDFWTKLSRRLLNESEGDNQGQASAGEHALGVNWPLCGSAMRQHGHVLLILDEIDHLDSGNSHVEFAKLIALANAPSSCLTLIGVANSLDLPNRPEFMKSLDKLGVRLVESVVQLHFKAYSASELEAIVKSRLDSIHRSRSQALDRSTLQDPPLFADAAVRLCSAKIAARDGDARAAFNVLRTALALKVKRVKADGERLSSSNTTTAQVGPAIVSAALTRLGMNTAPTKDSIVHTFPINTRLVLAGVCVAWLRVSGNRTNTDKASTTLKVAHEAYSEALTREGTLKPLGLGDFTAACDVLESTGLLRKMSATAPARGGRKRKLHSAAQESTHPVLVTGESKLAQLTSALKTEPDLSAECDGVSVSASRECARICSKILAEAAQQAASKRQRTQAQTRSEQDATCDWLGARI